MILSCEFGVRMLSFVRVGIGGSITVTGQVMCLTPYLVERHLL